MRTAIMAVAVALMLGAAEAAAQERQPRRQQTIEIRGQVPTPQVVTVRPREVPAYSRQVLVPNFYDHDFWPVIVMPYSMVPERMLGGVTLPDSTVGGFMADSLMRGDTTGVRPAGTTPALRPGVDTSRTPAASPPDTTGRTSGTAPARPPRR